MSARSGGEDSPAGVVLTTASGRRLKVPGHLAAALRQARQASPRVTAGTRRGAAADGTPASPSFGTAFPPSPPKPLAAGEARAGTAGQKEPAPGRPPLPPKRADAPQDERAGKAAAAPRRKSGAEVPAAAAAAEDSELTVDPSPAGGAEAPAGEDASQRQVYCQSNLEICAAVVRFACCTAACTACG